MQKSPSSVTVVDAEEEELLALIDHTRIPRHIAIIMDGNGRWARQRGLPVQEGHKAGKEAVRRVLRACGQLKIKYLTVFAFSTENWQRSADEVSFLMKLLEHAIDEEIDELQRSGVRVRVIGRWEERLPHSLRVKIEQAIERTKRNTKLTFTVALNYGGRAEIVDAARALANEVVIGRLDPYTINEETFRNFLYTNGTPDPDLIIRTGGEMRLSNFLLWQLAYAEFWATPTYWPDFTKKDLLRAILDYQARERRFGARPNLNNR